MAGHSQFKNIMHRKGRQDAQKSKLFSKLAREITVAAKMGQPDPSMNARLRAAIISARQENMSKDSIERAVKKATGSEGENYDEIRYEGYGPGGVAVIVEALTDNRNRAASDIRSYFTKSGGNLGETGSVALRVDRTGIIEYDAKVASDDAMLEAAIEAGADDVSSSENGHEIYASPETFREVAKALEAKFGEARKAALTWKPHNTVPVDDETGEKLLKLIELLNEHDDVQNVYANFEVSDALVARMGGCVSSGVAFHTPLSSPGLTGRSSIPEQLRWNRETSAYWIPRFSRGMTTSFCFVCGAPALSLPHDSSADSPSHPYSGHRSGPAPHRLGRDRNRGQPADVRRLRLGGTAGGPAAGEPPFGDP